MNRNKYILFAALLSVAVLAVALVSQIRTLKKQWHSTMQIIPGESKTRGDEDRFNQAADRELARPAVLVKFRSGVSEKAIADVTANFNDQVQDEIEAVPGLVAISDADNAEPAALAAQYQSLPDVEYAEPNHEISLDSAGHISRMRVAEPRFEEQWALANDGRHSGVKNADIRAMQAWTMNNGSDQIVVGILDTGVEFTHVDLASNMWIRPAGLPPYQDRDRGTIDDLHGFNALENNGEPLDEHGQGTTVAGIIGAECGNKLGVCGVNWKVRILPLKFLNAGGFGSVAGAIAALNYAIDRKRAGLNLRVINVSWDMTQPSRALADVIRKAGESGILFVVAAGSSNNDNDARPTYPAGYEAGNVISIAATDRNDTLAEFSNYGLKSVPLAAPGKDILTTALGNEYELSSGTSMAAAVVTGVAALTLSAHPNLSVGELRSLLLESVDTLPTLRGKVSTGGRINAAKAVGRGNPQLTR